MSDEVKNLNYYMDHPEEMPTDPAEIEKIMAAGESETGDTDSATPSAGDEGKEDEGKPDAEQKGEKQPDGVIAKDGKNFLPFAVLEKTRARNNELESIVKQQDEKLKALERGDTDAGDANDALLSDEDLADVEREMPVLGKVLRAQQAQLNRYAEREAEEARLEKEDEATAQKTVQQQVEEAKAANPKIIEWETSNPVRYDKAFEIDQMLSAEPEWKGKPFAERFAEVVTRVQRHFGDKIDQPVDGARPSAKELQERAARAVRDAGEATPGSLTDLPGGSPPGASAAEQLGSAHPVDVENAFSRMSDEQIMATLAKVA